MKEVYRSRGARGAGGVVRTLPEPAADRGNGYPWSQADVAWGVATTGSERRGSRPLLRRSAVDYIMEEFITGGSLVRRAGRRMELVFHTPTPTARGSGDGDEDTRLLLLLREIPADLEEAGREPRGLRRTERFFHFEFFATTGTADHGLEVNMRPPGA